MVLLDSPMDERYDCAHNDVAAADPSAKPGAQPAAAAF
jgi:hypothetical protein